MTLQLNSTLKHFFPQLIELCPNRLPLMIALLLRWPTLALLKRVHPKTLRVFLRQNGLRSDEQQTEFIQSVRAAVSLTDDAAVIEPNALYAPLLARQIQELSRTIAEQFEKQIAAETARSTPDQHIFRSPFPGLPVMRSSPASSPPSERTANATLRPNRCSAIAESRPWLTSSGWQNTPCLLPLRLLRNSSSRQTFREFADQARKWSSWSNAFYQHKRDSGYRHQAAVRALAFKWIRIIFHLWKTRATYDENLYIQQLRKRNSPVVKLLKSA